MMTAKLKRKASTGEFVVVVFLNGKRHEPSCYYTTDRQDAQETLKRMQESFARQDRMRGYLNPELN